LANMKRAGRLQPLFPAMRLTGREGTRS
jgi:hypothetical protein